MSNSLVRRFAIGASFLATACSPAPPVPPGSDDIRGTAEAALARLSVQPLSRVERIATEPWLGLALLPVPAGDPLPDDLLAPDGLTLPVDSPLFPAEWATRLSAVLEMPVRLEGDLPEALETRLAELPPWRPSSSPAEGAPSVWTGPLDEWLDHWTGAYGFEWLHEDGAIRVLRARSALLHIDALAGERSVQTSMGSSSEGASGSGASAGGSSSQRFEHSWGEDLWAQVLEQMEALAAEGTSITLSKATGTVAVHGLPADIARIRAFLDDQNRSVLRPISVTLELVEVSRGDGADFRADLSTHLREVFGSRIDFSVAGGGGTIGIVRPTPGTGSGNTLDAALSALASRSSASRLLRTTVGTLNGLPAATHDLRSQAYLASVSREISETGTTVTLEPGSVSDGYFFTVHPRIVAADRVLLRLSLSVTELVGMRTFSSGLATIQLPEQLARAVTLEHTLRPGETLIVSGFSDTAGRDTRSGPFDPDILLGGSRQAATSRTEQVLLVTLAIDAPPEWREKV